MVDANLNEVGFSVCLLNLGRPDFYIACEKKWDHMFKEFT